MKRLNVALSVAPAVLIGCLSTVALASDAPASAYRNVFIFLAVLILSGIVISIAALRASYLLLTGPPYVTKTADKCIWIAAHLSLLPWYYLGWHALAHALRTY